MQTRFIITGGHKPAEGAPQPRPRKLPTQPQVQKPELSWTALERAATFVQPMTVLDWYGMVALGLVLLTFYFVRAIPIYLALSALVIVGTLVALLTSLGGSLFEGILLVLGVGLCSFGLLIVRVMLIRSVSLGMLGKIEAEADRRFDEDIGGRLADLRAFGLIRGDDDLCELTPFGRSVSTVVAVLYSLFRVRSQ